MPIVYPFITGRFHVEIGPDLDIAPYIFTFNSICTNVEHTIKFPLE